MPIYEYQCQACGNKLETIQKHSEPPLTECPACHKDELKKLVSAAAFRLKGSGWYETDFKSGAKKNLAGGDEKSGSGGASGGKKDTGKAQNESKKSAESDSGSGPSKTSSRSSDGAGGGST